MKSLEWYREAYGDGEIKVTSSNTLIIPHWLVQYLIAKTGLKSKKTRIRKKVLKQEVHKALWLGVKAMKLESKDV